ncbi:TrmB family transcriptional regulator [Halomontanus rarus]|uniref:TrmB family transcriptional regulator n=1 Tax=Halomontanus rarus TaxID=3034020 RepID=UPI0023E8440D|nr:TrmB family transcriptional regulator [Halovivax sp. TS33]
MERDELITVLEDAGLSPYQADAFVTILKLGSASATDIAKASSVPDPRIYDVLRDLEEKGYIETYEQDSLHARAHSPAEVLEDLRGRADRFEVAADEIEDRWSRPDIEEHKVSIVKRIDTVLDRAESLIRTAENQIQIGVTREQFDRLAGALGDAHDRGVHIRLCLYPTGTDGVDLPSEEELAATCTEARYRDLPSPFVAIVDRSWTCFSPNDRSTNQYGVLVNDRAHAYVFHWYFLTCLWEVYEQVYSGSREEPPITYVDLRQCVREIEPLLEEGATLTMTVQGFDTTDGTAVERRGRVLDVTYTGVSATDDATTPLPQLAGEVSVTLETADGTCLVGGWGAMLEDLEATRLTIDAIE